MADYIYLLETRLSPAQQRAIGTIRTIARENDVTVFLTGGAVRDLTGGGSIRDLDLTVQGEAPRLKKGLEAAGATVSGENTAAQQLFLTFPGGVRVELASAMSVTFPKPGKPKYELSNISEDLRRRDFTANAMAISLNEGSYGLLMDPLNGVADIENRELRLVSNYGFIEEPSRLIRASRLMSRLGWQMEERTRGRYETAKEENYIENLSAWNRGYELEEIFHEEDPVRVMRTLEAEGWLAQLFPALGSAKANTAALAELAERQGQLQMQGILAQAAAIAFPLVTAKLAPADVTKLKAMFVRQGFVRELESLDTRTKEFATRFSGKDAAAPSAAWKLLHESEPNLVLAMSYGSKGGTVQTRLKTFLTESPTARQRIPYTLMQEMRITPDLPEFDALVDRLFFELMDGRLSTPEEMKAFLEPYSPPAPPPPVNLRRARAKKEARPSRAKSKKAAAAEADALPQTVAAEEEQTGIREGIMEAGDLTGPDRGPEPSPKPASAEKVAPAVTKKVAATAESATETVAAGVPMVAKAPAAKTAPVKAAPSKIATKPTAVPAKPAAKKAAPVKAAAPAKKATSVKASAPAKKTSAKAPAKKAAPAKPAVKAVAKKAVPAKKAVKAAPAKASAKKAVPVKAAKKAAPAKAAKKAPAKASKPPVKVVAKKAAGKAPAKKAPAKKSARR